MSDPATKFAVRAAEVQAKLEALQVLAEDHFNQTPEGVHWGHVGVLNAIAEHIEAANTLALALSMPETNKGAHHAHL